MSVPIYDHAGRVYACYRLALLITGPHASDSDSDVCKAWRTNRAALCNSYLEFIVASGLDRWVFAPISTDSIYTDSCLVLFVEF